MDEEHQYRVRAFDALPAEGADELASEVARVLAGSDRALLRAMVEACGADERLRDFGRELRKESQERLAAAIGRARLARDLPKPALDPSAAAWATLLVGDGAGSDDMRKIIECPRVRRSRRSGARSALTSRAARGVRQTDVRGSDPARHAHAHGVLARQPCGYGDFAELARKSAARCGLHHRSRHHRGRAAAPRDGHRSSGDRRRGDQRPPKASWSVSTSRRECRRGSPPIAVSISSTSRAGSRTCRIRSVETAAGTCAGSHSSSSRRSWTS